MFQSLDLLILEETNYALFLKQLSGKHLILLMTIWTESKQSEQRSSDDKSKRFILYDY